MLGLRIRDGQHTVLLLGSIAILIGEIALSAVQAFSNCRLAVLHHPLTALQFRPCLGILCGPQRNHHEL